MIDITKLALIAGCCFLCACSTGVTKQSVTTMHGQPDMIREVAGDMARFYLGSDADQPAWRFSETVYYYIEEDLTYTFKAGAFKQPERGVVSLQEHSIYRRMVENPGQGRPLDDYLFGDDYQTLWSVGDSVQEDWADGFGDIGFNLHEGKTINDLLEIVVSTQYPSLTIVFTDQSTFGNFRTRNAFSADYVLSVTDKSMMQSNRDPADYRWSMTLRIPVETLSIDEIEIPAGLRVMYSSGWRDLIEFHEGRDIESEDAPSPTTHDLMRRIRNGVFGDDGE